MVNKPLLTTILLCSLVGTSFGGGALGAQSTGRARAAIARATSEQKTINNTARKTATRAAVTTEKTTATRVTTNAVQSRSNSSAQKTVSKRAATTARAIRARAGETNQQVVMPISGGNTSVVKMYVDDNIASGYENLQKYVELSGNMGYVSLLKDSNKLPNLVTLFENVSEKNTTVRIDGAFTGNDSSNDGDMVYYSNGAAKDSSENIMPGSSIHLIASGKLVGDPSTEPVSGDGNTTNCPSFSATLTAWNRRQGTSISESDARVVGANGTNVADCAIIVTDADGFCRMARWNGNTYGYYDGALTYGDPVVNCDKRNSHLDGTVTVDVGADIDTAYSNMTFESVQVGIEFGQPLPSLAPLNNNRSNKVITLSGVYKTKSMATVNGVQSGTGQIWGADGAPAVTSVSNMNSFAYSDYQKMYFAYGVWNKGAATVENTCSNKLSDYQGRMTGDTFIKTVQTTNQSTLAGIEDCAAIVHDSIGLCWALKMNNSARQLIPCADEINTYNLGYGMVRMNQFTPSGYNPDTYESSNTYYFLPWAYNNPVSLMDTNNGYTRVLKFRTTVGSSYGKDENGNTGMLQLPDLTKYVNNLTPPEGKKFAGIYSMWGKDVEETYHIYGNAGGDFKFTSTKLYDETGKAVKQYIKLDDLPWTYPGLANTGGRPFYMFIIWDDAEPQGDDSCPVFDKSVQGSAWNSITPIKYVRAKNAADRKSDKTDCAIIYEDADGFCRIAPYKVQPAYQGLPAISVYTDSIYKGDGKWIISSPTGGLVVDCNKEYSDIDAELLVLTHAGGIKSAYDETQTLLFNQLRIGINYGETLPSLAPFVQLNKYYSPNAVLVGGFSKNHMSAGGQPCAGISAGGCVSLPESEKYWGADGNPVKTIANQTEIQNNFDGHDGVYEPSLLWNTVNETVADCPVPTGVKCASGDTSCSNAKRYPHYWTQNGLMSSADVATFVQNSTFVRNVLLFGNTQNGIAKCGAIIRDGDGLCWVMENNRECTSGTDSCMYRVMDCDLGKYTIESDGTLPWSAGGQRIKNIYIDDSWDMNGNGKGKLVTPTNPTGIGGIIKILYQWEGDTSKNLVFPDLSGLVSNMERYVWNSTQHAWEKSNKQFAGIYSNKDCSGTRYYDDTGKPIHSTMTFSEVGNMYMCWTDEEVEEEPSEPIMPDDYDCPSVDESLSSYANANANISDGHLLSAPDGETISSQSACTWIFTDGDGMCRIGKYTYKVGSKTYYDWNGSIVACNTTTIGNDHGFDVDVGPIMDTVPTAFWDQDYLRLEDRLTYRYNTTLPSLKPYVDRAKEGSISGHYTFMGGYVGDSCSITYSDGKPTIGPGCTHVYNDDGTPAKTLSSSDSNELTLAWDYSDNSWANYASICPTTRAEYNKDFNKNSSYIFPEDEVSASCTVQRALVTSNNSVISPASDCAILCEDTLGVCYAKTTGQDKPSNTSGSTGMVSCDTTGYVDTTKSVVILDDGSEGDAVNTVRYNTFLPNYSIRYGEHTIIFVQPSNTWPSVSNLIADLYHCGGANSHDGCTNGDDGKTFRGIYTEPNCAGTQIYDENGDYNTSTSVTYEDLPAVAWGKNHKKVYMCWQ